MITLRNSYLTVKINELGSEITSVMDPDNTEYMWQADPQYWGRHAPILFPIVGKLKNDQYQFAGKTYSMTQHGFARDMGFTVTQKTATSVKLQLISNKDTSQKYPFAFELTTSFELVAHNLKVTMAVKNPEDNRMLFSIGAHPGFNVPIANAYQDFSNYYLQVAPKKQYKTTPLTPPYSDLTHPGELDLRKPLFLEHDLFSNDAQILNLNGRETTVMLANNVDDHGIALTVNNAPYIGIWSPFPKHAPFICIEPWWGIADSEKTSGDLKTKTGMINLAAHEEFNAKYSISFF